MIREGGHRQVSMAWGRCTIALCAIATALALAVAPSPACSQTLNDALSKRVTPGEGKDRLLLEAKELVYDNDNNNVSAVGDVQSSIRAGRSRPTGSSTTAEQPRVRHGQCPHHRSNGTVITGDRFNLTDDSATASSIRCGWRKP